MWAGSLRQKTASVASLRLWPIITVICGPLNRNTHPPSVVSAGSAIMILFLALAASTVAAYHAAGFDSHVGIGHGKRFAS